MRSFPSTSFRERASVRPLPPAATKLKDLLFKSEGHTSTCSTISLTIASQLCSFSEWQSCLSKITNSALGRKPAGLLLHREILFLHACRRGLAAGPHLQPRRSLTRYVPQLKGGAYEGVSIRNILQMASGVKWTRPTPIPSPIAESSSNSSWHKSRGHCFLHDARPRAGAPGSVWNYSTGESFLVGALLEGATHKPLANLSFRDSLVAPRHGAGCHVVARIPGRDGARR